MTCSICVANSSSFWEASMRILGYCGLWSSSLSDEVRISSQKQPGVGEQEGLEDRWRHLHNMDGDSSPLPPAGMENHDSDMEIMVERSKK